MALSIDLTGRVVLVTGGREASAAASPSPSRSPAATVVDLRRSEPDPFPGTTDVQSATSATRSRSQAMIDGIVAAHDRLDVLIDNAGGAPSAPRRGLAAAHDKITG